MMADYSRGVLKMTVCYPAVIPNEGPFCLQASDGCTEIYVEDVQSVEWANSTEVEVIIHFSVRFNQSNFEKIDTYYGDAVTWH